MSGAKWYNREKAYTMHSINSNSTTELPTYNHREVLNLCCLQHALLIAQTLLIIAGGDKSLSPPGLEVLTHFVSTTSQVTSLTVWPPTHRSNFIPYSLLQRPFILVTRSIYPSTVIFKASVGLPFALSPPTLPFSIVKSTFHFPAFCSQQKGCSVGRNHSHDCLSFYSDPCNLIAWKSLQMVSEEAIPFCKYFV